MIIEDASFNEVVKFISTLELTNKEELLKLLIIDIEETKKDDAIKANPNDPVMNFRRQLNKENQKLFDDTLAKIVKIEEGYDAFKKQYTGMKDKIKRTREKLAEIKEEEEKDGKDYWHGRYMESQEVSYIEKRFPIMDKAIESYKESKKYFTSRLNQLINSTSNDNSYFPQRFNDLESGFSSWFSAQRKTKDAIRISEKHFDKIKESFAYYYDSKERKKKYAIQAAEREAAAAAALIAKDDTDLQPPNVV